MHLVTSKDGTKIADEARRVWRWLLVGLAVVAVLAGAGWVGLAAATSRTQLARAIVWASPTPRTTAGSRPGRRPPDRTGARGLGARYEPGPDLGSGARRALPVLVVGPGPAPAGARLALGRYGQHLYVVADSELVLVGFGRDAGYRSGPELLDELARRLDGVVTA
jgi:hypothetical protein